MIFFVADTHFSHNNIVKYCNRPFADVEEMNTEMVNRWNNKVGKGDVVYHLGDFGWLRDKESIDRCKEIANSLNGTIILIKGNHDDQLVKSVVKNRFAAIRDLDSVSIDDPTAFGGKRHIILCHYALRTWKGSHHGTWSLYGHTHGTLYDDPYLLSTDVGVDCWNFTPVSEKDILSFMHGKMKIRETLPVVQ